jgi:hypothetical protein
MDKVHKPSDSDLLKSVCMQFSSYILAMSEICSDFL